MSMVERRLRQAKRDVKAPAGFGSDKVNDGDNEDGNGDAAGNSPFTGNARRRTPCGLWYTPSSPIIQQHHPTHQCPTFDPSRSRSRLPPSLSISVPATIHDRHHNGT